MANPQIGKGHSHTSINNEIMKHLCKIRIPGEARQILDFILLKTYGFSKKEDWIALSQFVTGTGVKKPETIRALKKLLKMNIVGKKANGNYFFNKNYDEWEPLPKKKWSLAKKPTLAKKPISVGKKANKSLAKKPPTLLDYTSLEYTSLEGGQLTPLYQNLVETCKSCGVAVAFPPIFFRNIESQYKASDVLEAGKRAASHYSTTSRQLTYAGLIMFLRDFNQLAVKKSKTPEEMIEEFNKIAQ
jgi:phage replication O-like protein O